jgi:hypothetical protein
MGLAASISQAVPPIWDVNGLELLVLDPEIHAGQQLFISGQFELKICFYDSRSHYHQAA